MIFAVVVASVVPLAFLYLIHQLDVFNTNRPRLMLLAFLWGALAFGCSYAVNHPMVAIVGKPFVATRIAPVVEEIFKSLVLLYLIGRADFNSRVDGAVYGFAAGVGFSVAENMLYLSRVDVNAGVVLAVTRVFSSSVLHGSTTAIVGGVIGGRARRGHGHAALLLVGWAAAIALHMAFNRLAFSVAGPVGLYVISGIAFVGALAAAVLITLGVRQQALWLRRSLVSELGIAPGEARLVQRLDELAEWVGPLRIQFGEAACARVEALVRAEAQLIVDKDVLRRTRGRAARVALAATVAREREDLDQARRALGMALMARVRTLVPGRGRSMWKRLATPRAGRIALRPARSSRRHRHSSQHAGLYQRASATPRHGTRVAPTTHLDLERPA